MIIKVKTSKEYEIVLEKGSINHLKDYFDVQRKIMVITDDNVSKYYLDIVLNQLTNGYYKIVEHGEKAKSFAVYESIIKALLENNFSRNDLIIALGGGVIGDLAGFCASTYKRGIEFINIPTSTLAQIDSSIGGKVAINVDKVKNCVGAFHQPSKVIIDINTLQTLSLRQFNNGLVEAIKAGLIKDEYLFTLFENDYLKHLEEIIYRSLIVKKDIVEIDEFENNIRKILNFGHTIGHGFESYYELSGLLHGEAVAIGMVKILENDNIKERLINVLKKLNINTDISYDKDSVFNYILSDKKAHDNLIDIIKLSKVGSAYIEEINIDSLRKYL